MNKKSPPSSGMIIGNKLAYIGLLFYILTLGVFAALLLTEPEGMDIRLAVALLAIILFVSGLAPARLIASTAKSRSVAIIGAFALAILFAFVGLFALAGIGWLVALANT